MTSIERYNVSLGYNKDDSFLDRKIIAIQRSTKTRLPFFAKTNEWLRQHSKWYYKLRIDPLYRFDSLDEQLEAIQKSTRTTFRAFAPLHDWLRLHSVRYYFWSINSYSNYVHFAILGTYSIALVFISLGILNQGLHNPTKANIDFAPDTTEKMVDYTKIYSSVPKDAKEVPEKRNANTKAFRNTDGSLQYIISSGILHYKVGEKWYNIDSTIEPNVDDTAYLMNKSIYVARFDKNFIANPLMAAVKGDQKLSVKPGDLSWSNNTESEVISVPKEVQATSSGHDVTYKDAYGQGLDFGYETEDLQLNKKLTIPTLQTLPVSTLETSADNELYLKLKLAFTTEQNLDIYIDGNLWDGSMATLDTSNVVFKKSEEVVWQLTPAKAWDSQGEAKSIIGKTTIKRDDKTISTTIAFPYSWLKTAQYPVTIDPATVYANTDDGFISGTGATYTTAHDTSTDYDTSGTDMQVGQAGKYSFIISRGFLRFDTSAIEDTATVSQANLHLTVVSDSSDTDFDIDIFKTNWTSTLGANTAADYTAAHNATKDVTLRNTSGISTNTDYASPNLTTSRIIRNGYSYFILKSSLDTSVTQPFGFEYVNVASQDNATTAYRPYLSVITSSKDYTWDAGGDGVSWSDANNWDLNSGYPDTNEDKAIINTGSAAIATPAGGTLTVGEINVGASYSGTITLGNTLDIDNSGGATANLTIANASAILNVNGKNIVVDGTVSNVGTIQLIGSETTVTMTAGNDSDSGTVEYTATSSTYNIKYITYFNLKINGSGGTFRLPPIASTTIYGTLNIAAGTFNTNDSAVVRNMTVNGDVTVTGTLVANSSTITLLANWDSSPGTFTNGTSTLDFTGAGTMKFKDWANVYNIKAAYTGNDNHLTGTGIFVQNVLTLVGDATGQISTVTSGWFGFKSSDKLSGQITTNGAILAIQTYFYNYSNTDVMILPGIAVYSTINLRSQVATGHFQLGGNITASGIIDISGNNATNISILDLNGYTMQNASAIYIGNGTNTKNGQIVNNSATTDASIVGTSTTYGLTIYAAATPGNNAIIANGTKTINITLASNWSNADTYTAGAGTVTFNASSGTQTLNSGGVAAANTFNNLTHSGAGTLQLTTNAMNVDGVFTNSAGTFGANSLNMTFAGNWNNTGTATFTRSAGTMTFDGTSTVTNSSANAASLAAVVISGTATLGSSVTMASNSGAGTLNLGPASYTLTLTGTGSPMGITTFAKGIGSTVIYSGTTTATTIATLAYNNLTLSTGLATTFSMSGDLTAASSKDISGNLTINSGATLQTKPVGTNYNIDCAFMIINSGGVLTANASLINVSFSWTNNGGTYTVGTSVVTFIGSNIQTIGGTAATQTFYSIVVAKTGGSLSASGSTTTLATTTFTLTSGSFTPPATFNINGNATLTAGTLTAGTNINVKGNWTNNGATFTPGTKTVTFNGTGGTQNINGSVSTQTFYSIVVAKTAGQLLNTAGTTGSLTVNDFTQTTGDFTAPATFNLTGNLTLTAGTFTAGTNIAIRGNWSKASAAIFTHSNGTVTFNGTVPQSINGTSTVQTFYNVVLAHVAAGSLNTGGSTTSLVFTTYTQTTGAFTLPASFTVNGNVVLTAGTLTAGTAVYANGDWTNDGATFTVGTGTIYFASTTVDQVIKGSAATQTFYAMIVNKNGKALTVGGSTTTISVNGYTNSLGTFTTPATFNVTTNTTLFGGILIAGTNINVGGNWINNGGTFTPGANTVTLNGSGAQSITGTAGRQIFSNIVVAKTAGQLLNTAGTTGSLTVNDFTQTTGDFTAPATFNATGNVVLTAGTFTAGTNIAVSGNWTNNGGTFTQGTSMVTFNGTGTQTIAGTAASQTFYNVMCWNSSSTSDLTVTLGAGTMNFNDLTWVASGANKVTLDAATNNPTVVVAGNFGVGSLDEQDMGLTATPSLASGTSYGYMVSNISDGVDASNHQALGATLTWQLDLATTQTIINTKVYFLAGTFFQAPGAYYMEYWDGGAWIDPAEWASGGANQSFATWYTYALNTPTATNKLRIVVPGFTTPGALGGWQANIAAVTGGGTGAKEVKYGTGSWSIAGNVDVTSTTTTQGTSTVTMNGTVAQTITGTANWYNLTINNSYASPDDTYDVDPAAAQTVTNTLTVTDGQWTPCTGDSYKDVAISAAGIVKPDAGASITVSGNWTVATGATFTYGTSTVVFSGSGKAIGGTISSNSFYNLTVNSGASIAYNTSGSIYGPTLTANGTLTIASAKTVTVQHATPTISIGASGLINGTTVADSILEIGKVPTITLSGTNNFGSNLYLRLVDSTASYSFPDMGGVAYTAGKVELYANLGPPGGTCTVTPGGALHFDGDFLLTGTKMAIALTLDFNNSNNSAITFSGNFSRDESSGSTVKYTKGASDTVTFDKASGTQTFDSGAASAFLNIAHSGAGTLQLANTSVNIDGDFTNSAGTFDTNSLDMTVAGSWNNTATFTKGTRTVTFDGTATGKTINGGASGFYTMTINGSGGGWTLATSDLIPLTNLNVTSGTLNTGVLKLGLPIGSSATVNGGTLTGGAGDMGFISLTVSSGAFTGGNGIVSLNSFTVSGGTFTAGSGAVTVGFTGTGSYTHTSGTADWTTNSSSLIFASNGASIALPADTYNNLTLSAYLSFSPAAFILAGSTGVNGNLSLTTSAGGTSLAVTTYTLTVGGNLTLNAGTVLSTTSGTVKIAGNWANSGTFTKGTGTVEFNGSAAQTITGTSAWYNLTINNTYASPSDTYDVDPNAAQTVTNTLTVTDGQWTPCNGDAYKDVILSSAGGIRPDSAATITVSGDWTDNGGSYWSESNTISFNGAGSQTINGTDTTQAFSAFIVAKSAGQTLTVSGGTTTINTVSFTQTSGNFTAPATFNVNSVPGSGTITLIAGTFTAGASITLDKDWINNGATFVPGTGTVTFAGPPMGNQLIQGTASTQTFYDVVTTKIISGYLACSGSTTTLSVHNFTETSGNFNAPATFNINGNLILTAGNFSAGTNINAAGNWTNNGGSFIPGTNTVTFNGTSGTQTINGSAAIQTFYILAEAKSAGQLLTAGDSTTRINTTDFTETTGNFTGPDIVFVARDMVLTAGTFTAGPSTRIGRNFTRTGTTFTHSNGNVIFDGVGNQTIAGDTIFYDLTMDASANGADTINFTAGSKQTITHNWLMNGASGKVLTLRSSSPGTAWKFDIPGNFTAGAFINVQDSQTDTAYRITPGANITNSGRNEPGWIFTLSLWVDNASLDFGNLLPGSVITGYTETTVTINYLSGYSLSVHDSVAGTNSTLLHPDATTRIADYAGTIATPTSWSGTGLGICFYSGAGKDAKWGTGTTDSDSNNKYAGVPQNDAVVNTNPSLTISADKNRIGYKVVVPNTQKTGTYTGIITYTAIPTLP